MQITRRAALTGATALAAALPVPTLARSQPDDTALFSAIARWREARDPYEAGASRMDAILRRVDAEMPEYCIRQETCIDALHASCAGERTAEKDQRYHDLGDALAPFRKAYDRRCEELGYDEDVTDELSSVCWDVCHDAMAVPSRTLAGLRAKLEMFLVEHSEAGICLGPTREDYGPNLTTRQWRYLVADIRHLAGDVRP